MSLPRPRLTLREPRKVRACNGGQLGIIGPAKAYSIWRRSSRM